MTTPLLDSKPLSDNERLVLDVVRRHGQIARAAVTAQTPLTQPWVHRLVDQLLARGLLVSGEPQRGTRGQPSVTLSLARDAAYALGISIDPDAVRLCLIDLSCAVLDDVQIVAAPSKRERALQSIVAAVGDMCARNGVPRERLVGAGFAIPGFFIAGGQQINAPEPLREWSLVDLQPLLQDALGLSVVIQNNATAAAIGENMLGVGRWARTFCYLAFGYGFGSGLVIQGKPYLGRFGNAGELIFASPGSEPSRRPALRYLLDALRANGVRVASVEQMRERFDPNWPGVDEWIEHVQPTLDQVLNAVAGLLDPDAIVFGGELPAALGLQLIGRTRFWVTEHRYGIPPPRPRLVLAEAGSRAAAIGAALTPLSAHFFDPL
jgi:predicted NBD/HSP70 family sugar kinase